MKTRYILAVVIFIFTLLTRVNYLSNNLATFCKLQDIGINVPLKLQEAITSDGGQNPILTRFFHNKPLFYTVDFTQCYLKYFHPLFLLSFTGFLGFLIFIYGAYQLLKRWRLFYIKMFLVSFFFVPLLSITGIFGLTFVNYVFSLFLWIIIFYAIWLLMGILRLSRRS